MKKLFTVLSSLGLLLSLAGTALAAPPMDSRTNAANAPKVDNLPNPLADRQNELRAAALAKVIAGEAQPHGSNDVVRLGRHGKFVELTRQDEDTIWTTLGEFGTQVNPTYGGTAGPLHNQIPEPDRHVDNSTIWEPDFSQSYFEDLLFSEGRHDVSMRKFYIEQSSNRYTVNGTVEDWVTVPYNEANYGSDYCGDIVCARTWLFVRDSVNAWYNERVADGWSNAQIEAYLAQFDTWDRYDYDGDGNFDEPDGYIDHYQAVHAGEGEETGGGAQGTDAIWSHRWYAFYNNIGVTGPAFNPYGGVQVGGTSFWIGDYTVEPENGGVGVFAHEFGHDLGLPDLYDTSGNVGGAENSTGFWTLYSSGSYGSTGRPADGIGTKPISMSAYEKLILGWADYKVVPYGDKATVKLNPSIGTTNKAYQTLLVTLPDKNVTFDIGDPYAGSWFYHSGSGNDIDNAMTRSVTLPAGAVNLSAKVRYDIELDWDYAYLTVNGTPVATNLSTATDPNGQNFGEGITGTSSGWVDLTANLSAFAGQTVTLGFRYWTDGATVGQGFGVDDITITGLPVDGAESDPGWTYTGFSRTTGENTVAFPNYYVAEYRTYLGYDAGLRTGPYNFSFGNDPVYFNWVQHFPYQDGLLIWYLDYSFADNNIGDHCADGRCGGLYLPVDAHPKLLTRPDNGQVWRPRVQSYDSTFGLDRTNRVCLWQNSEGPSCFGWLRGNPKFNDNLSYWVAPDPSVGNFGWSSVIVPHTGTTIRVADVHHGIMTVKVNK